MNRRDFLKMSGVAGAIACLAPVVAAVKPAEPKTCDVIAEMRRRHDKMESEMRDAFRQQMEEHLVYDASTYIVRMEMGTEEGSFKFTPFGYEEVFKCTQ